MCISKFAVTPTADDTRLLSAIADHLRHRGEQFPSPQSVVRAALPLAIERLKQLEALEAKRHGRAA